MNRSIYPGKYYKVVTLVEFNGHCVIQSLWKYNVGTFCDKI